MTEIEAGVFLAIIGAVSGAVAASFMRRRDEKDRHTGERIGSLEKSRDRAEGYADGLRDGLCQARDGRDGR